MAQLERSRSRCAETPRTPKQQNAPTFDQLLKVDESCSPTNQSNQESCVSPNNNKKSVLSKVREGAKKLKSSLSGRKSVHYGNEFLYEYSNSRSHSHNNSNSNSPLHTNSHSHTFDDDCQDERADDPEYLGAPMYESEAAPENLKETARQHPRATPVVAENHRTPNKTRPENADKFTSKFSGLAIALSEPQETAAATNDDSTRKAPAKIDVPSSSNPGYEVQEKSNQYRACSSPQIWDKGVSVKEYFMSKLEPGDDERELSHAITEAISPRRSSSNSGVVDKVREAVNSFFRQDDSVLRTMTMPARSYSASARSSDFSATARPIRSHSMKHPYVSTADSSSQFTRSNANANDNANVNANEVLEEENNGKILQTN